jgi:predicted kinase
MQPTLIALIGPSGSGKSTLIEQLRIPLQPYVINPRLRAQDLCRFPRPEIYHRIQREIGRAIRQFYYVIVDARHIRPKKRRTLAFEANRAGATYVGIWLDTSLEVCLRRQGLTSDPSESKQTHQIQHDYAALQRHTPCLAEGFHCIIRVSEETPDPVAHICATLAALPS